MRGYVDGISYRDGFLSTMRRPRSTVINLAAVRDRASEIFLKNKPTFTRERAVVVAAEIGKISREGKHYRLRTEIATS